MGSSVTSSEIPLLFPHTLYILHSSLLPSRTIKPCIKHSYGTYSVFRRHTTSLLLFLPLRSALFFFTVTPTTPDFSSPPPPYQWIPTNKDTWSKSSQLPVSQRISVLTLGEENNWLRRAKQKELLVGDVLFGSLSLFSVFLALTLFFPSSGRNKAVTHSLRFPLPLALTFHSALNAHLSLPDLPSLHMCPSDHLWICFPLIHF